MDQLSKTPPIHAGRTLRTVLLAAVAALGVSSTPAFAIPAITSFSTGISFTAFNTDETVGWRFTVAPGAGVTVTSLGWWDQTPTTPLAASHEVGIWSLAGTLLGSVIVQTNSVLTGSFRYEAVNPIALVGGVSYVIGGRDIINDGDNYSSSNSNLVMDPMIAFNQAARSPNGSGFAFPGTFTNNTGGRIGPNFDFRVNGAAVPEPGTLPALLLGLGLAAGVLRRRAA